MDNIVYYTALASIDINSLKVLQLKDDASFSKLDVCGTMKKLRNNPYDKNNPESGYYDMIIIWTGEAGLCMVSANDKRFSELLHNVTLDGCLTMSKLKKDKFFLSILTKKKSGREIPLSHGAFLRIWETPFGVQAITDYDKNYGDKWYWRNGKLVYVEEGNKFGDTSLFFVFGLIMDRPNRFRKQLKKTE